MARKKALELCEVTGDHSITTETDPKFLVLLQKSILLDLREQNLLTAQQLQNALEKLSLHGRDGSDPGGDLLQNINRS